MKIVIATIFVFIFLHFLNACERAKEGDFDGDDIADILIKGNKIDDIDKSDHVLIIDGVVVNGITNQQWKPSNGQFLIVEEPTFKMQFNSKENKWEKSPL